MGLEPNEATDHVEGELLETLHTLVISRAQLLICLIYGISASSGSQIRGGGRSTYSPFLCGRSRKRQRAHLALPPTTTTPHRCKLRCKILWSVRCLCAVSMTHTYPCRDEGFWCNCEWQGCSYRQDPTNPLQRCYKHVLLLPAAQEGSNTSLHADSHTRWDIPVGLFRCVV